MVTVDNLTCMYGCVARVSTTRHKVAVMHQTMISEQAGDLCGSSSKK